MSAPSMVEAAGNPLHPGEARGPEEGFVCRASGPEGVFSHDEETLLSVERTQSIVFTINALLCIWT